MNTEKISISEQVEHFKERGVTFTAATEADARSYLKNNCYYFRIKAYEKCFEVCGNGSNKGKYVHCDFAALRELSILDMRLREYIVMMAIDIEHYLKTKLIYDISRDRDEDGKTIIHEVFPDDVLESIESEKSRNSMCADLIKKFNGDWTIWSLVEILSFSDTIKLYQYFYSKHPEYPEQVKDDLQSVRYLRNAAAHNNCLLNSISKSYTSSKQIINESVFNQLCNSGLISPTAFVDVRTDETVLTTSRLRKKMENRFLNDFIVTVFVYNKCVSSHGVRKHRMSQLSHLFNERMVERKELFVQTRSIISAYRVVKKVVDFYSQDCI